MLILTSVVMRLHVLVQIMFCSKFLWTNFALMSFFSFMDGVDMPVYILLRSFLTAQNAFYVFYKHKGWKTLIQQKMANLLASFVVAELPTFGFTALLVGGILILSRN